MTVQNYRLKCRNDRCGYNPLKRMSDREFEDLITNGATPGINCFKCGYSRMEIQNSKQIVRDGFIPGYQRNIKKICNTYAEYKTQLKLMGLIELGYEDQVEEKYEHNYWTDDMVQKAQRNGLDLSGRQIEALKQGKKISDKRQLKGNLEVHAKADEKLQKKFDDENTQEIDQEKKAWVEKKLNINLG